MSCSMKYMLGTDNNIARSMGEIVPEPSLGILNIFLNLMPWVNYS